MIGHGLAHVSFAGVAIGLFLDIMPMAAALFLAVFTALIITRIKNRAGLYSDTAIAMFSSAGFALGILIVSLSNDFTIDLFGYLFGEILAIQTYEVWLSVSLAVIVVLIVLTNYQKIMYMTFDQDSAKVSGINTTKFDTLLTILTAVTVVLGMKVVGILLVSALLVIPAAAGLQIASNFRQTLFLSSLVAIFSVVAGLTLSFFLDFPASGSIVLLSFLVFIIFFIFKKRGIK